MRRVAMLSVHSSPLAALGGKEAGGMNVYVRELSRELGRRGVAVDIFTRIQQPHTPTVINLAPNVRVVTLRAGPPVPYDKNWLLTYLPEFVSRVRCFAEDQDLGYDVIHSHYWLSGLVGLELRQAWGLPLVHMFHTLGVMKNLVARAPDETETQQRVEIERQLLEQVDLTIAATPLDRAQMVWHYGARQDSIEVVPCGVDLSHFRQLPKSEARMMVGVPDAPHKMLLFVGRIEPLKGIDTLLRALAIVAEQRPEWRSSLCLTIIGGDRRDSPAAWSTEMMRLRQLMRELHLDDLVVFMGSQDQHELPIYYNAADIVLVPSHYESFGMVALESMACGTPVIASNVGGLSFTVRHGITGMLVPQQDPPALAEKMLLLLNQPEVRRQLGEQAAQTAQRYSWPAIAGDIIGHYGRLICAQQQSAACAAG